MLARDIRHRHTVAQRLQHHRGLHTLRPSPTPSRTRHNLDTTGISPTDTLRTSVSLYIAIHRRLHRDGRHLRSRDTSSNEGDQRALTFFRDAKSYYATRLHETVHWTKHESRLNRDFGRKRWGDEGYAMEELVAEIGAAFLSADLGITPELREDHASYVASWLKVLKDDKRAIFNAASDAQRAAGYLHELQPVAEPVPEASATRTPAPVGLRPA